MALSVYTGSDEKWSFAEQVTWGTAVSDSASQVGIHCEGFGVDSEINFRNPPRYRGQRYDAASDTAADQKGIMYQTNGANIPALIDQLDYLLYGVMQNVTETAGVTSGYKKTFTFPLTQPDFTANEGEFFTLWGKQQVASNSQKINDAIVSELQLSCSPGNNEGMLYTAPTFVARSHSDTANPSGSVTYPSIGGSNQYNFYDIGTANMGSTVILGDNGFTITIHNNAKKVGQSSGIFQSFVLPHYDVEIAANILWDSTAQTLMANAKSGTNFSFEFEWGTGETIGHLEITGSAKITNAVNLEHALEGNFVTVNMKCFGIYGGTEPFKVIMVNNNNRGW